MTLSRHHCEGGEAATMATGGIMDTQKEEAKKRCVAALTAAGANQELCQFFSEAVQFEYDMTHTTYRMLRELREAAKQPVDVAILCSAIQSMSRTFVPWSKQLDSLTARRLSIPSMNFDQQKIGQGHASKALCSLVTNQLKLNEGEEMTIIDTSQPNRLKLRNKSGAEGFVPILSCVMPSPDTSTLAAVERLQLHLLMCWAECEKRSKTSLREALSCSVTDLTRHWNIRSKGSANWEDRINRRLKRIVDTTRAESSISLDCNRLHKTLSSLENELLWRNSNELSSMITSVANLDKAVLTYQAFRRQWRQFRRNLLESPIRPIRLIMHWDPNLFSDPTRNLRYYEVKLTAEETVVKEEVTNVDVPTQSAIAAQQRTDVKSAGSYAEGEESYGEGEESFNQWEVERKWKWDEKRGEDVVDEHPPMFMSGSRRESVDAEQLVSVEHEENTRFTVRSVLDPRTGRHVSIDAAVRDGIVDYEQGVYQNPDTGEERCPIAAAMNDGRIRVERVRTTRSKEQKQSIGLITLRQQTDTCQYSVVGVVNEASGNTLSMDEGRRLGVLDLDAGLYVSRRTGQSMSLDDAIERGLVIAEFDSSHDPRSPPPEEITTYAINAVVDQLLHRPVPFLEAVERGLIDRETGCYVNNATGQRVFAGDAIRRGLFKGNQVTDPKSLIGIEPVNRVVVDRIDRVRKNVLREVKVVSAFKAKNGTR